MNKRLIEASQLLGTIVPLLENSSIEFLVVRARDAQNRWVEFELEGNEARLKCWSEDVGLTVQEAKFDVLQRERMRKMPGTLGKEPAKVRAKRDAKKVTKKRKHSQTTPIRNVPIGRRELMPGNEQPIFPSDRGYQKYQFLMSGEVGCLKCSRIFPTEQGAAVHNFRMHGPNAVNRKVKRAVVSDYNKVTEVFGKSLEEKGERS